MINSNKNLFPIIEEKNYNNICNTNANESNEFILKNNNKRPTSYRLKKKNNLKINNDLYEEEDEYEQKQKKLNNLEMQKINKLKGLSPDYSNPNNNNQNLRYINPLKDYDTKANVLKLSKNKNNNLFKKSFNNNNINLGKSNYELDYYKKINKDLKQRNESLENEIDELNDVINKLKNEKDQLIMLFNKQKYQNEQIGQEKEDIENKLNKLKEQLEKKDYFNKQLQNENMNISNQLKKERKNNKELKEKISEYETKLNSENSLFMLSNINFSNEEKEHEYPKGEYYFQLIKDYNINEKENDNNNKTEEKQSFQLYFSLNNIPYPNNKYSFKISIINNKSIENTTFLGSLEERTGNNIEFGTVIQIDYFFEREQILIIEPVVNDEETEETIEYPLCDLIKNYKLFKNIENIGILQISYINTRNQNNQLNSEISYLEFYIELNDNPIFEKKKKFYDVYYLIKNFKDGNVKRAVYKSMEYNFQLNKKQKTSSINLESNILCENKDQSIFFELYIPSLSTNNYIGYSSFTLNCLENISKEDKFYNIKIKHNKYGEIGTLEINYNTKTKMTFEEFIKKGQINLDIAIDYTKSNGDPNEEHSLHYLKRNERNDYEKAIKACGDIIGHYDSDELFPVYGFGGIPEGSDKVSHCFNVNMAKDDPNIHGIDNIIKFYRDSLRKITLSTPTYFAPIIKQVINEINYDLSYKKSENHYYILMILTDGILKDMDDTINCIVDASKLPLSIVIIGIGDSNFTGMDILDGDEEPLKNSFGEVRKRDIVQFVKFNSFKEKEKDCGTELAEEVLKEIPRQIEEYYRFFGEFYEK